MRFEKWNRQKILDRRLERFEWCTRFARGDSMTATLGFFLLTLLFCCASELGAQWRPTIRSGSLLRMDFRAMVQADGRAFSPQLTSKEGTFDVSRVRLGLRGRLLTHFEYEGEYEFRETFGGRHLNHPLRDAFVNFDYFDDFQLRIGKFKLPFSQEQNTGAANLDFILRSRIADELAPGRDLGAMLHGRFFNRGIGYEAGVFKNDGENAKPAAGPEGRRTVAVRVTGRPFRLIQAPGFLKKLETAVAGTSSDVPEGLANLRGHSYSGKTIFPHLYTKGRRLRTGADLNWTVGDFSLKAEYAVVKQQRDQQSVHTTRLPDVIASGWYVAEVWNLIDNRVQIAARYDAIRFGSGNQPGVPSRSPRTPNILENSDRAWTLGLNWFLTRQVKVQINGIRETLQDVERSPINGRNRFWMGIARVQFVM
jgi:phosphate-selective porin OprO and OprP